MFPGAEKEVSLWLHGISLLLVRRLDHAATGWRRIGFIVRFRPVFEKREKMGDNGP
jgi:hypothetical protein